MEDIPKVETIKELSKKIDKLSFIIYSYSNDLCLNNINCTEITQGIFKPITEMSNYYHQVISILNEPEAKKEYTIFQPLKKYDAYKAKKEVNKVLTKLEYSNLSKTNTLLNKIGKTDIKKSLDFYITLLNSEKGKKMNSEQREKIEPVELLFELFVNHLNLEKEYSPYINNNNNNLPR